MSKVDQFVEVCETGFDFDRIDPRAKQITPSLIQAVTQRIVDFLHPAKIILFGSQARQTATEESDLDILIILEDQHPLAPLPRRERREPVSILFAYCLFPMDVFILTNQEVRMHQETNEGEWDFFLEILDEGTILYDQSNQSSIKPTSATTDTGMVQQS